VVRERFEGRARVTWDFAIARAHRWAGGVSKALRSPTGRVTVQEAFGVMI
jgi:hypothetical protein